LVTQRRNPYEEFTILLAAEQRRNARETINEHDEEDGKSALS